VSKLQLKRLKIKLQTNEGIYGADISFQSGLNIIRADNTFGKSTCVQSIIFALGLEGTLGPSRKTPLKSALISRLNKEDGSYAIVSETVIYLEIANRSGTIVTIARNAAEEKHKLISVYEASISQIESNPTLSYSDYFVRDPGAAIREKGFHQYLERFLGIIEPEVIKYDGNFSPLYLESIFAVNYVEQTRGWGGILNVLPTYLGIRDISNRIIEYTLDLDIQENNKKRQKLIKRKADLESLWQINVEKIVTIARQAQAFVRSTLPDELNNYLVIDNQSDLYVVTDDSKETSVLEHIEALKVSLAALRSTTKSIDTEAKKTLELEALLNLQTNKLNSEESAASILISDIHVSESYIESIEKRTAAVKESLRKYRDIKKLQEYGSAEEINFIEGICPTCNQHIEDSLIPHMHSQSALGVDDNIKYLEKQKTVFESMNAAEIKKLEHKKSMIAVIQQRIHATRAEIRNIKEGLIEVNGAPSRLQIRKEIILEETISQLDRVLSSEKEIKEKLQAILIDWTTATGSLAKLPWDGFSQNDRIKLQALTQTFKSNLSDFEYKSTSIDDFEISKRTYKPAIDDVDLGSEASASDNIRVIWAYMYSLLILDSKLTDLSTNHLGLLILDEPRQQETKEVNFKTFIEKAAQSASMGKQIIIATSEKSEDLSKMILDLSVNVRSFDKQLLARMQN
jgi:hypothetical protein